MVLGTLLGVSWTPLGILWGGVFGPLGSFGIALGRPRASQIRRALVAPAVLNELECIMNVLMYYECLTGGTLGAPDRSQNRLELLCRRSWAAFGRSYGAPWSSWKRLGRSWSDFGRSRLELGRAWSDSGRSWLEFFRGRS